MNIENDYKQLELNLFDEEEIVLKNHFVGDDITKKIIEVFDYQPENNVVTTSIIIPSFPKEFNLGVIVGSSGSGKSTLLKHCFGEEEKIHWDDNKCVASHFENYDEATSKLGAVGLNSIPSWLKNYKCLSNGEKFRVDLARRLKSGAIIDEFTSVVNRETAISCSCSIKKYIDRYKLKNVVIATCHDDVIPFLQPDWVYNTDKKEFEFPTKRPSIQISIERTTWKSWGMFKKHHYLSGNINKSARCYLAKMGNKEIGFVACLPLTAKGTHKAWREHRLVVLPDYQGMGIGNKLSEAIAQLYLDDGYTYYSKTANARVGEHRNRSNKWKPTINNMKARKEYLKQVDNPNVNKFIGKQMLLLHANRVCYSHQYVGENYGN